MSALLKKTRLACCAALISVASIAGVHAASAFTPVPQGFVGTAFRGVALGQSQVEVEAALIGSGFRCLGPSETKRSNSPVGQTVCELVRADTEADVIPFIRMIAFSNEQATGIPMNAITFVDDRASAIAVEPDFFNAAGMSPYDFAKSIIANYPLPNGLDSYGQGWRGVTENAEQVVMLPIMNGQVWYMMVTAATTSSAPSFN